MSRTREWLLTAVAVLVLGIPAVAVLLLGGGKLAAWLAVIGTAVLVGLGWIVVHAR